MSAVEKGEGTHAFLHIIPAHMSVTEVRCCCTAAVGMSVFSMGAFGVQRRYCSVGWNRPDCARDGTQTRTDTHA